MQLSMGNGCPLALRRSKLTGCIIHVPVTTWLHCHVLYVLSTERHQCTGNGQPSQPSPYISKRRPYELETTQLLLLCMRP